MPCPDNCSGNGHCNTLIGACACTNGFRGVNCAIAPELVLPIAQCRRTSSDGTNVISFGFENRNNFAVSLPLGDDNQFAHLLDAGQPTSFTPGLFLDAFRVPLPSNSASLTWTLNGITVTANLSTTVCAKSCVPPSRWWWWCWMCFCGTHSSGSCSCLPHSCVPQLVQ